MKLNKYLFNTVNNKELRHGQRSVVWLKRGQPCLHQLHVLSTVFSWRPLSSFSLWIILLLSDSCCFLLFVQTVFFLSSLSSATLGFFCNRCFFVIWGDNFGGCSSRRLAMVVCLAVSPAISWFESSKTAFLQFSPETDRLWFCVHLPSSQAAHKLSGLAVHELSGSNGSQAWQLSGPQAQ